MIFTEKRIRRTRNVLISLLIICLTPICEKGRLLSGAKAEEVFAGKELVCAIDLGKDMRSGHWLETGFSYELVRRFAQDNGCTVRIIAADSRNETEYIDSLRCGKADIVITHIDSGDTLAGVLMSRPFNECSVWMTDDDNPREILEINKWISHYSATEEYADLKEKFHSATNPVKRASQGVIAENVSPYDEIIKTHAADLGWDWRLLAAVIYQESKFSISSKSHRGATGLMQVMPRNAARYGIDDLTDPENNILAGTTHLSKIQDRFKDSGFTHDEMIKFTLAAYNAGAGRITDCRRLAATQGLDNSKWENIVKVIPMMREDAILEDESVKLGKFQGHETIAYVDNVMRIYRSICVICPKA